MHSSWNRSRAAALNTLDVLRPVFKLNNSDGSVLNNSFILNESLMWLEKNESSWGVIRSVAHAYHPIGSGLELVHLFQVLGFFESFVHHVNNAVWAGKIID